MPQQFEFCRVCRQNHKQGRGHRYSTKHKKNLELLHIKTLDRIQEIRHFVKNVALATDGDRSKFWCHFCEQEISETQSSTFARAQAITHLASHGHAENIKHSWAEHGMDAEKQRLYIIDESDLASWEEACRKAEAETAAASEQVDGLPVSSVSNVLVQPEEASRPTPLSGGDLLRKPMLLLSEIKAPSLQNGEGNVHSGAAPPWLKKQNPSEADALLNRGAGPSGDPLPLSRTQQAKLAKVRNPNRVGAAWAERRRVEIQRAQTGETLPSGEGEDVASWFPNFGRVWQSGPRRDSRKEFEAEKRSELQNQRRGRRSLAKKNGPSRSFEFKPYVSRKQKHLAEQQNSQ